MIDEYSRVLRSDGCFLKGLYAVGNTSASLMGSTSLGAGVTLGPAIIFSYVAMEQIAKTKWEQSDHAKNPDN